MGVRSIKEMAVYRKAYELAMSVFEISKGFPPEERYALTGQIRRSSRSVCNNLREAWAKRRYEPHFVSKLSDCDGEANETDTSLDFARDCGYISEAEHDEFIQLNSEVCCMLGAMIKNPGPFLLRKAGEGRGQGTGNRGQGVGVVNSQETAHVHWQRPQQ